MKLKPKTLSDLADMITGGSGSFSPGSGSRETTTLANLFPYRSGPNLTAFFQNLELDYEHEGSRVPWTKDVLKELNAESSSQPDLPPDILIAAMRDLMDAGEFAEADKDRQAALERLNKSLARDGVEAFFDDTGLCQLRAGATTSAGLAREGAWSQQELRRRSDWHRYLDSASEDEFTEKVLVPLLRLSNFQTIQTAGHQDKSLEYGKDLWMRFRLPTGHFIYFAVQVKKGKLDAAGRTKGSNASITEVLNQVRMALDHDVFDHEVNRKCLVDHVYVVATGEITKQARNFLVEKLDRDKRRQVIFMDRDELLDLLARQTLAVPSSSTQNEIPF